MFLGSSPPWLRLLRFRALDAAPDVPILSGLEFAQRPLSCLSRRCQAAYGGDNISQRCFSQFIIPVEGALVCDNNGGRTAPLLRLPSIAFEYIVK